MSEAEDIINLCFNKISTGRPTCMPVVLHCECYYCFTIVFFFFLINVYYNVFIIGRRMGFLLSIKTLSEVTFTDASLLWCVIVKIANVSLLPFGPCYPFVRFVPSTSSPFTSSLSLLYTLSINNVNKYSQDESEKPLSLKYCFIHYD